MCYKYYICFLIFWINIIWIYVYILIFINYLTISESALPPLFIHLRAYPFLSPILRTNYTYFTFP